MFSKRLSLNKHSPKFQALDCSPNKGSDNSHKPNYTSRRLGVGGYRGQAKASGLSVFSLVNRLKTQR
jgi:hypothetical protein